MPYSYPFYKEDVRDHIVRELRGISNPNILDVGAGAGAYADLLPYKMDAVEIYEPYIERFNLRSKYRNIIIDDILNIDLTPYDYIIMGDVLEHIPTNDAQALITKMEIEGKKCMVAIPYLYEQGEWEGNVYETHHQPDLTPQVMERRYPTLRHLYGNAEYAYYVNYDSFVKPNLIISAGRRFRYFEPTLLSFTKYNGFQEFNKVYILDDRSSTEDRVKMCELAKKCFNNLGDIYTFDDEKDFEYVEKFNLIKSLMGDSDYVFLLEDDWVSVGELNINKHIQFLEKNPHVDLITFSQRFDLQWDEIQQSSSVNDDYWKNPFPERYKHMYEIRNGHYIWQEVRMNNYGNNPSIYRRSVFEDKYFIKQHAWELDFADRYAGRTQYFTKKNTFVHIGVDSLIDIIPKK